MRASGEAGPECNRSYKGGESARGREGGAAAAPGASPPPSPGRGPRSQPPGPHPRNDEEEQFLQEGECARRPRPDLELWGPRPVGAASGRALGVSPRLSPAPGPRPRGARAPRPPGAPGGGGFCLFTWVGVSLARRPTPARVPWGRLQGARARRRRRRRGDNEKLNKTPLIGAASTGWGRGRDPWRPEATSAQAPLPLRLQLSMWGTRRRAVGRVPRSENLRGSGERTPVRDSSLRGAAPRKKGLEAPSGEAEKAVLP